MAVDPITLIQGASAIAGFLGSRKKQKTGLDLGQLRREAKANGFNPLTVLRMTGGAGFDRSPQPNMLTSLADLGMGVSSAIMGAQDREIMRRESDARIGLMSAQQELINRPPAQLARQPMPAILANEPFRLETSRFAEFETAEIPYWNVRDLTGQPYQIRADVLERLGLAEGSTIMTEDFEMILGEIGGEMEGIGQVIKGGLGAGQPWMNTTAQTTGAKSIVETLSFGLQNRDYGSDVLNQPVGDFFKPLTTSGRWDLPVIGGPAPVAQPASPPPPRKERGFWDFPVIGGW